MVILGESHGIPRLANALVDQLWDAMVQYVEHLQRELLGPTLFLESLILALLFTQRLQAVPPYVRTSPYN